jgi:predicted 2-oxoglutarate/Fe(II)-dependent dioxygenase YbiX
MVPALNSPTKSRPMMFVRPEFCLASDCARIRAAMDSGAASPAEIYVEEYRVDQDARRASEVEVADDIINEVQRAIDGIRPEVSRFFGIALSGDEGPGFLRYTTGGFYGRHLDVSAEWDERFPRRISVIVFLTSAGEHCEGGALRVYLSEVCDVAPRAGTLVAFPSDVPHEVLPVTSGVRDVVVDWLF